VNIDAGNIGAAIITNLKSLGPPYTEIVRGVNFGGTSQAKLAQPKVPGPRNRRAEMWGRVRDYLNADMPAKLPDMDALQTDLTAPKLVPQLNNDFLLESKDEMKKRGVRSPDLADSVALTFAFNEYFPDAQMMRLRSCDIRQCAGLAKPSVHGIHSPAAVRWRHRLDGLDA
jgi:hypothetical protein